MSDFDGMAGREAAEMIARALYTIARDEYVAAKKVLAGGEEELAKAHMWRGKGIEAAALSILEIIGKGGKDE